MGFFRTLCLAPLSWIYGGVVRFRNNLFSWGVLKSQQYDIPIVCVGNITVGGTGKTPHTEYLVELLSEQYNVAVLSRGYKRKTKGFVLATPEMSFKRIGDEPKQIKLKFPQIPVAVCEKRREGIRMIRELHPEVNLIILDDAFQHQYVDPWVSVVLTDYKAPVYEDHMMPLGRLRDNLDQLARAQIIIVTKCPKNLNPLDYRIVFKNLELYPYQTLYFTSLNSDDPRPLYPNLDPHPVRQGHNVVAMSGLANPRYFLSELESKYNVLERLTYPDHYAYKMRDIYRLETLLKTLPEDTIVVVTEKDAVKLLNGRKIPVDICRHLHYVSIKVDFCDGKKDNFYNQLKQYVAKNQKHNITHPE